MQEADAWAVLFDLDGTLVETSAIRHLRDQRRWAEVYAAYDRTFLLPEARVVVRDLAAVAKTGIVTMAQRRYATTLVEHHDLRIPVLIAYGDVPRSQLKPHPRPILEAAARLGVAPGRTVYVGDEPRDVIAARRAGALSVAFGEAIMGDPAARDASAVAADWPTVRRVVMELMDA